MDLIRPVPADGTGWGRLPGVEGRVDPVERVLNLLTLLHESPRPLTRAEIVDALAPTTPYPGDAAAQHQMFSSDRRTIVVDLGIAIHQRVRGGTDAGRTEYWIDVRDVHLPRLELDDEERLVLSLALAAVSRSVPHVGEASMRLSSWIGATAGASNGTPPYEFSVEVPDPVVTLMDAARNGRVIELDDDVFEPWAVVLSDGSWHAIGHDGDTGVPVAIRVDRFATGVDVLDGQHRSVEPLDLDEESLALLLRGAAADGPEPGDGGGDATEGSTEVATVLVDEVAAVRASLAGRVLARSQVDLFGEVALKVAVDDDARFRSWLLALADRAELAGPPRRRDEVVGWLRAIVGTPPSGAVIPDRPTSPGRRRGPEPVAARLHRLLSIVPWLYRQRSVPVADVAERVGASVDQVVRDLTLASMCGTPPYGAGELYGFWVEPETGTVNVLHPTLLTDEVRLTPRQAASVAVALASIEALPGDHRPAADRLRRKLDDALGPVAVRVTLDDPPFLADVVGAVEGHERIRIEYVDPADRVTERVVDPQRVFVDRGTSYVIADDELRHEERVFRIDRMVSVTPTGEHFEARDVTTPAGARWTWMVPDREVVVRLPPGSDWVLDRYATLAHELDADGWMTVWLAVVDERWLAVLLLRCGAGAEVLAPDDLVGLPQRWAASVLERYDGGPGRAPPP